jgi:hypothetical protein
MLGYLTRLTGRMQKRAWRPSDPTYLNVIAAQDKLHRVHLSLRESSRLHAVAAQNRRPWERGAAGPRECDLGVAMAARLIAGVVLARLPADSRIRRVGRVGRDLPAITSR